MIEQTLNQLNHDDATVRYEAAQKLGSLNDTRAVAPLIDVLPDKNSKVQYAAFSSLIKLGSRDAVTPLVDLLINKLDSQVWALLKLNIGLRLRKGLIELVEPGDLSLSDRLQGVLDENDTLDEHQRAFFIRLIGKTADERRIEKLIRYLARETAAVKVAAAEALGMIGDARAVPPLTLYAGINEDTLSDAALREVAIEALGRIGDPGVVDLLIASLSDENEWIRRAAAEALGCIGDAKAMHALVAALQDEDAMVQDAAFDAIKKLNGVERMS